MQKDLVVMPIISALGSWIGENQKFKVTLDYVGVLGQPKLYETLSKQTNNRK